MFWKPSLFSRLFQGPGEPISGPIPSPMPTVADYSAEYREAARRKRNGQMNAMRDEFAGKAMQGFCSLEHKSALPDEKWAEYAYNIADAMLAERAKRMFTPVPQEKRPFEIRVYEPVMGKPDIQYRIIGPSGEYSEWITAPWVTQESLALLKHKEQGK